MRSVEQRETFSLHNTLNGQTNTSCSKPLLISIFTFLLMFHAITQQNHLLSFQALVEPVTLEQIGTDTQTDRQTKSHT